MSTTKAEFPPPNEISAKSTIDAPIQGMALVFFGIGIFSIQDIIIRDIGDIYPGFEIMFFRGLVALGPITLMVYLSGGFGSLKVPHLGLNILRGLLGLVSYTAYYMGLQALPLAEATAIFFISPLIVTLLSALFLGEVVRARRWAAVIAGFIGVVLIASPSGGFESVAVVLPILAASTYACSIIITRQVGKTQSGASLAFYAMLVFVVFSGLAGLGIELFSPNVDDHPSITFLLRGWVIPGPEDAMLIGLCGLIASVGFFCLAQGYRVAPVSLAAPFEFISMPLAVLWGYVIWSEFPSSAALMGIVIIIASGVYVLKREASPKIKPLTTGRGVRFRL